MKVRFSLCEKCKKGYDYELYDGLCPHCSHFNRNKGVSVSSIAGTYERHVKIDTLLGRDHYDHKDTRIDPHLDQMKRDVEKRFRNETMSRDLPTSYSKTAPARAQTSPAKAQSAPAKAPAAQARTQSVSVHKTTVHSNQAKYDRQETKKGGIFIGLLFFIGFAAFILAFVAAALVEEIDWSVQDNSVEVVNASAGQVINDGDFTYNINSALVLCDDKGAKEKYDISLPDGSEVIAVYMSIGCDCDIDSLEDEVIPYCYDGSSYVEPLTISYYDEIAEDFGIGNLTLNRYSLKYGDGSAEGYVFYAVDKDCDMVTISAQVFENSKPVRVYDVSLEPEYINE